MRAGPGQAGAAGAEAFRFGAQPALAVAAGLAQRLAGDEQARALEQALLDRGLDAVVGAAGVAQRGEAAMQHGAHGDRAFRGEQRQRHVGQQAQVHLGEHDMDVRVDQPRHQRAAAEVDARGRGAGDRAVGDLLHRAVLDQDRDAVLKLVLARIEEATAAEQIAGHDLPTFPYQISTKSLSSAHSRGEPSRGRRRTMRVNEPITDHEVEVPEGEPLVSRTDRGGTIVFANHVFVEMSGFAEQELIGSPHNIVRHPLMPQEAFANLWATIKAGRPWDGLVKNRAKTGDFYWVRANVTPVIENGEVTGYISIRSKPTRAQIAGAERAYADIRAGKAKGIALADGEVVRARAARLGGHVGAVGAGTAAGRDSRRARGGLRGGLARFQWNSRLERSAAPCL